MRKLRWFPIEAKCVQVIAINNIC